MSCILQMGHRANVFALVLKAEYLGTLYLALPHVLIGTGWTCGQPRSDSLKRPESSFFSKASISAVEPMQHHI
jgi:hypothetical protein